MEPTIDFAGNLFLLLAFGGFWLFFLLFLIIIFNLDFSIVSLNSLIMVLGIELSDGDIFSDWSLEGILARNSHSSPSVIEVYLAG